MTRSSKIKALIAALILLTLLPMTMLPTSAMKAINTYLRGTNAMGIEIPNDNEVIIQNQSITFDISKFPAADYDEESTDYDATVTTEYMFYNPTDSEITMKLSYPIGSNPNYNVDTHINLADHIFKLNGEVINPELRHLSDYSPLFDNATFASLISDEYIENEYCDRNTTVTKYTFYATDNHEMKYFAFELNDDQLNGSVIYYPSYLGTYSQNDGYTRFYTSWVTYTFCFDIYIIGNDLESFPDWKVYDRPTDEEAIEGEIKLHSKSKMTLSEFIFENYDESVGISKVDFYNIAAKKVTNGIKNNTKFVSLGNLKGGYAFDTTLGFVYEINLEPGEVALHSISAPLYPSVETKFEPHTYDYSYILSYNNAKMLEKDITVNINTPYCLLAGEGLEKTDNGYSRTLSLAQMFPEGASDANKYQIFFTLCEVENPEEVKQNYGMIALLLILVAIIVMPILLIEEAASWVINGVRNIFQK